LSVLYGTTLAVNLLLFMVVFPLAANYVSAQPVQLQANQPPTSAACGLQVEGSTACPAGVSGVSSASSASLTRQSSLAKLTLQVDIPCPGHAPLISGELKKLPGMRSVQFRFANYFDVEYDSAQVTQTRILGLDVFKTYAAKIVS
jgi:copper chaperone CopZ